MIDRGRGSSEDRYVLFESPDGGDTWALKQESSKPLSLKNAAVPAGTGGSARTAQQNLFTWSIGREPAGIRWALFR